MRGLSHTRRAEIGGIIIMAIAALHLLSIVSYHPDDYDVVKFVPAGDVFSIEQLTHMQVYNWLGILGAFVAYMYVDELFGYMSMGIPLLVFILGWYVFRGKSLKRLFWFGVSILWTMVLLSTTLGWFYTEYELYSTAWSGNSGIALTHSLQNLTGGGSIAILSGLLFVTFLILMDRDLQKTSGALKKALARRKERRKQKKEIRRIRKEEKAGKIGSEKGVLSEGSSSGNDQNGVDMTVFTGKRDKKAKRRSLFRRNKEKDRERPGSKYTFPTLDLLDSPPSEGNEVDMEEVNENKKIILDKLRRHKIEILSINAIVGPTVTLYELEPAPDVKISKIQSYANDLKMATAAHGLRIITPIPGRAAVGIEVPSKTREKVYIRSVIDSRKFADTNFELPVAFGKTIENDVFMVDLSRMPHLLIAGATGSGKSVGINTIITCLLYKCHPDDLKFIMIDPKKIELSLYRHLQNHYLAVLPGSEEPIVTDTAKALETLNSIRAEMDERYDLLKMAGVRNIKSYNQRYADGELDGELGHRHLPYIVVIIDELADLMMTAGKEIEAPIARIAQLARAIGIHLVVATQRPSVNVITGTIKANFSARIAYQVASKVDSRTILDTDGADQLVGDGDLLFTNGGGITRIQNAFVSTEEVERITAFIGNQTEYRQRFLLPVVEDDTNGIPDPLDDIDPYFEAAAKVIVLHQQGSVSLLQRRLKIGYNRAGRIIDQLFNAGIVGPYQGSSARDVLVENEEELREILEKLDIS